MVSLAQRSITTCLEPFPSAKPPIDVGPATTQNLNVPAKEGHACENAPIGQVRSSARIVRTVWKFIHNFNAANKEGWVPQLQTWFCGAGFERISVSLRQDPNGHNCHFAHNLQQQEHFMFLCASNRTQPKTSLPPPQPNSVFRPVH